MDSTISGELGHALPSSTSWSKFKLFFRPKQKLLPCKTIKFHHAGYNPQTQETVIFRLQGCQTYSGGVRASTAILFFSMLVDSKVLDRIHISTSRGGRSIPYEESDHWTNSDYYIHSRNPNDGGDILYQYPLIASFGMWSVPEELPQVWRQRGYGRREDTSSEVYPSDKRPQLDWYARCSEAVVERDRTCVITGKKPIHCKRAFFIPIHEKDFWVDHQMSSLLVPRGLPGMPPKLQIVHPMNSILMHTELAQAFEEGEMVILPVDDHWVAHFFDPDSYLTRDRDNKKINRDQKFVRMSTEIPKDFVLVSVAMAAFKLAEAFLEQNLRPAAVSPPSPPTTYAPSEPVEYLPSIQTYQTMSSFSL